MNKFFKSPGFAYALIAAFLFGASTPFSKLFLAESNPWFLAGMLYLGSGIGLLLLLIIRSILKKEYTVKFSLARKDLSWLGLSTLLGGIVAPVLLMHGLARMAVASASLFLNMESALTAALAWFFFKEHFGRRILIGIIFIILGGLLLAWAPNPTMASSAGPLFIIGACLGWALDNNVTRKISANNPLQITIVKSLAAGATNLALASAFHLQFPQLSTILLMSILGFLSYGVSLSCFIMALRHIGTARTGALFSIAPFVGTALAVLFFHEPLSLRVTIAGIFMGLGVWLHLTEKHSHEHTHEALEHKHQHIHDEHHQHEHSPTDPPGEPHTHWHKHEALTHTHLHYPDIHHRHSHKV